MVIVIRKTNLLVKINFDDMPPEIQILITRNSAILLSFLLIMDYLFSMYISILTKADNWFCSWPGLVRYAFPPLCCDLMGLNVQEKRHYLRKFERSPENIFYFLVCSLQAWLKSFSNRYLNRKSVLPMVLVKVTTLSLK